MISAMKANGFLVTTRRGWQKVKRDKAQINECNDAKTLSLLSIYQFALAADFPESCNTSS
jgi:hypothetical protein